MSWNLPDGCTDEDIDRANGGYDEPEPEDPDNVSPESADYDNYEAPVAEREEKDDATDAGCPF